MDRCIFLPKFRNEITILNEEHTREAIARRLEEGPARSDLRDFVYGAIDGAVRYQFK